MNRYRIVLGLCLNAIFVALLYRGSEFIISLYPGLAASVSSVTPWIPGLTWITIIGSIWARRVMFAPIQSVPYEQLVRNGYVEINPDQIQRIGRPEPAFRGWSPPEYYPIERREAYVRSRELLVRLLDEEQLTQFETSGMFDVRLRDGRFATLGTGRIIWPDRQTPQCVMPSYETFGTMPEFDIIVCQLIHLRNDPNRLRVIGRLPVIGAWSPKSA